MSAVLGSEEDNDWVKHFWSTESIPLGFTKVGGVSGEDFHSSNDMLCFAKVRLNIKSWQATGWSNDGCCWM